MLLTLFKVQILYNASFVWVSTLIAVIVETHTTLSLECGFKIHQKITSEISNVECGESPENK